MGIEGTKERFDHYRKWFSTFLRKEFFNQPSEEQGKLLSLINKFRDDCEKCHQEHKNIKEKVIRVLIEKIEKPDNKKEHFIVHGKIAGNNEDLKILYTASNKIPEEGSVITYTIYSLDERMWYSSKEELITGRV